jgi:hypothetical protein
MEMLLKSYKIEEQSYKSCGALMKLADRFSFERIENACERALYYTPTPSIKMIQTILKTGQDSIKTQEKTVNKQKGEQYGFTRRNNNKEVK